jgi:ABC-type oligopeptide transport system ATPase subunit
MPSQPLLEANNLVKHFPVKSGVLSKVKAYVRAVDGVSFNLARRPSSGAKPG